MKRAFSLDSIIENLSQEKKKYAIVIKSHFIPSDNNIILPDCGAE